MATYKARNAAGDAWLDLEGTTAFKARNGGVFIDIRPADVLKARNTTAWVDFPAGTPAPTITLSPTSLADAPEDIAYSEAFVASGGTAPYTYARTAGSLPAGLSLAAGGGLTGTPTTPGAYAFTITATDAGGFTGSRSYNLDITATAAPTITLSPSSLSDADEDVTFSRTISASGGNSPYTFVRISGALPPGMSLSSGGLYSGTPTTPGNYSFTIRATDQDGFSGTRAYTHEVIGTASSISSISTASNFSSIKDVSGMSQHTFAGGRPYGLWMDGPMIPWRETSPSGDVYIFASHSENWRFRVGDWANGSSWDLAPSTRPAFNSAREAAESSYNNRTWIFGVWAEGNNVWALCHMEWYKHMVTSGGIPGFIGTDPATGTTSRYEARAAQWLKSTDGGSSWAYKTPANSGRVVLVPEPNAVQNRPMHYGFLHPSNIVKEGSYYYCFVEQRNLTGGDNLVDVGFSLIRTNNLDNATGWQYWNGSGWTSVNHSTYQGNLSSQQPYIFFRVNNHDPYVTSDRNNRMAQAIRWHIPTAQWLLFGSTGMQSNFFCWTRSATMANPQFETNGRQMIALTGTNTGNHYIGARYISVFDPDADNSDNQNFMNIGNNPLCWTIGGQVRFERQTLQINL